jgi:hypothetical protein
MTPEQKRLLASLGLVDLSLLLLWLGGLITFDGDTDPGDWILPVCFLGILAAGVAIVLSWPDRVARRSVGLTLVVIAGAMVVLGATVDGFGFVYAPFVAEFVVLVVVLALVGILIAAPPRIFGYAVAAAVAGGIGLWLGGLGGETVCGSEADDCALAALGGLFVAGVMVVLVLIVAAGIESRRASYAKLPKRESAGRERQR